MEAFNNQPESSRLPKRILNGIIRILNVPGPYYTNGNYVNINLPSNEQLQQCVGLSGRDRQDLRRLEQDEFFVFSPDFEDVPNRLCATRRDFRDILKMQKYRFDVIAEIDKKSIGYHEPSHEQRLPYYDGDEF